VVVDGKVLDRRRIHPPAPGYPYAGAAQLSVTRIQHPHQPQPQQEVNYIRNSVKATVDAYR
jgi:uncharacterized membrane protein (UPF0182 family)